MSCEFTCVEREGPITIITLNRPHVLNALHPAAHAELNTVFDQFAVDPAQWVAIVTGAGERAFCTGYDLAAPLDPQTPARDLAPGAGFGGLTSRFDLNKPVIAAVNGVAMGGGFELALACDIIIAAEHAQFALPEPRVGLAALAGGPVRLARAIGEKRAMELIMTARRVSAAEGRSMGFISQVAASGELMAAAHHMARTICEASPKAIRATKEMLRLGLDRDLRNALTDQWSFRELKRLLASEDVREGPRAFKEKRAPVWSDTQ